MIVIVTGGGRGIGAATAEVFAARGYDVLVTSRSAAELEATRRHVQESSPQQRIHSYVCDVSEEAEVKALFTYCHSNLGRPNVVVNNAGLIRVASFLTMPIADWDLVQSVNIRGTMLVCKQAFAAMQTAGGSIVNISSLGGVANVEKFPGFAAYTTSKAAVIGLTQALAVEGGPLGIRVNCIAPGAVQTRMLREAAPGLKTKVTPHDLAKTIFSIGDDELARHINGTIVEVFSNEL